MSATNLHVIVGLGVTGLSCARYLQEKGIPFAINDTRINPPHLDLFKSTYPSAIVSLGGLDAALLQRASTIILSPGIALHEPLIAEQVKRGIPIKGDIELFAEATQTPVIAITGTNAKSTVTTLVGKMVKAAGYEVGVGGNLGVPALDLFMDNPASQVFVLELSSFQLETTDSLNPRVATVLNVTPDHMDRYHDLTHYQQAKLRIYQHCHTAIWNRDDPLTHCSTNSFQQFRFTLNPPQQHEFGLLSIKGAFYLAHEQIPLMPISELPVAGRHYQANALAALAIGHGFGLPMESMLSVLTTFKGLPHRCQLIRERASVKWYNDSKGTNVGATQAAIEGLGREMTGKIILIAGGVGKNADFSSLVPMVEKYVRHVILIGEAAQAIAQAIDQRVAISFAQAMDDAVKQAAAIALPEDSVLLSPACASWDMFSGYAHRGEIFTQLVEQL